MEEIERRITADMDPLVTAREMATDEIVFLKELRSYLEAMAEMCYQTIGDRWIKNPRIWSLHDIRALYGEVMG